MLGDFEIVIVSHRPDLADECAKSFLPNQTRLLPGCAGAKSIATLFNWAIESCKREVVLIACDRIRAHPGDVSRMLGLIEDGYGIVALHGFRFFGAKIDLFREVGLFDETFPGGSCSDGDMILRLFERDIAYFEDRSVEFLPAGSSWTVEGHEEAMRLHRARWRIVTGHVRRLCPPGHRPCTNFDAPGRERSIFLPWGKTSVHGGDGYDPYEKWLFDDEVVI